MNSEAIYEEYANYYADLGKKLFDETVQWDEKEREYYLKAEKEREYYLKAYWDWCSLIETAELRGRERALKKSMISIARKSKQIGFPIADIAKATGLSEEEIQQL